MYFFHIACFGAWDLGPQHGFARNTPWALHAGPEKVTWPGISKSIFFEWFISQFLIILGLKWRQQCCIWTSRQFSHTRNMEEQVWRFNSHQVYLKQPSTSHLKDLYNKCIMSSLSLLPGVHDVVLKSLLALHHALLLLHTIIFMLTLFLFLLQRVHSSGSSCFTRSLWLVMV